MLGCKSFCSFQMSFHKNRNRGIITRNINILLRMGNAFCKKACFSKFLQPKSAIKHTKSNFGKYSSKLGTNRLLGIPYFCNMINMNQIVV